MPNSTPYLGLELFSPIGVGWREDATAGVAMDFNMEILDAVIHGIEVAPSSSVEVNSATVPNPNFNDSLPAAPAGKTNVKWQVSGSSVSGYVDMSGALVTSVFGRTGAVTSMGGDYASFYDALGAATAALSSAEAFTLAQGYIVNPMTAHGDMLYENASLGTVRLPIGSTGQVVTVVAGQPAWVTPTVYDTLGAAAAALSTAEAYTDSSISSEVTRANAAYDASGAAAAAAAASISKTLMTTLGDTIFENSTPTPARLAGNTTTTKMYLSQTGDGAGHSASPAWAQIAYGDLSGTPSLAAIATSGKWSDLQNGTAALTLANGTNATTFNQTSAVAWLWANTTAATTTSAFYSDGSSLTGWTNSGVTVDAGVGNPSPSFSFTATKYCYINAGVANGTTVQFDFYGTSLGADILAVDFGQSSSGNGPRFRLDLRTAGFTSGFSISAAGAFPNDGGPSTGTKIVAPTASAWHRLAIVIAANGLSASWYLDGAFQASGALSGGILGGYLCFYLLAGGAGIWVDNIAVYSASVPANSPTLNLSGTYWNAAGNASAVDTWTLQNVTESSPATPPILAITHAGSTDAAALVQVPNLQPVGNIVMGTTAITFGATYPVPDLGLSRFTNTAGRLAVGAGAAGDYSGAIACAAILGPITANGTDWAWYLNTAGVHINGTLPLNWGSGAATGAIDSGISRLGAASLAIGNGTAGDFSGTLRATVFQVGSASAGISLVTGAQLAIGNGTAGDTSGYLKVTGLWSNNSWDVNFNHASIQSMASGFILAWSNGSQSSNTLDTGISRLGAASLAIGNGTGGDTTGNLSFNKVIKYAGVATVSAGVPSELATVDLTAQSAAIAAGTALYSVPATGAGLYRVSCYAKITTASDTSSVLGGTKGFQLTWTDPTDSTTPTAVTFTDLSSQSLTGNTTTTIYSTTAIVACKASTNLQYGFDYSDTHTSTAMAYKISIKVEYLG